MDSKNLDDLRTCWAVIPAGGSGKRFLDDVSVDSESTDKLMAVLEGVPVLARTVARLFESEHIAGLLISARPHCVKTYQEALEAYDFKKPIHWVDGGETRRDSVYNAISALPDAVRFVAVHDAARPLVNPELVDEAIEAVFAGALAAFLAIPLQDTLKEIDSESGKLRTVDRQCFIRAQTPQVFEKSTILKAHEAIAQECVITDDIQLLELFEASKNSEKFESLSPSRIQWIKGSESNLKITTQDDMRRARQILREQPKS